MVLFFRGKFRHISSSESEGEEENDEAPSLLGNEVAAEMALGMGCLALTGAITALLIVVVVAMRDI